MADTTKLYPHDLRPMETAPHDGTQVKLWGPWIKGDIHAWGRWNLLTGAPAAEGIYSAYVQHGWISARGLLCAELTGWEPVDVRLGPHITPYWTTRPGAEEPQIRLWTGYSWLDFGIEEHIAPDEVKVLSEGLEFDSDG